MSKITVEEVLKLAKLSHIKITEEEAKQYTQEIESILGYVEQLNKVDTTGLEPTAQVTRLVNATREDKEDDYKVTPEELIDETPDTKDRYIRVKRVL